jgi:hypothetical protein
VKPSLFPNSAALVLIALALGSLLMGQPYSRAHAGQPDYDLLITKISNKKLWGQSPMTLGLMRDARARSLMVTVDQYAYTASSTSLDSRLPAWLRAGGLQPSLVGRHTFFSDCVKNIDCAITKIFSMPWEGHTLMLRADMFNAFNHVQYGIPSASIANTNFGAITGTAVLYLPRNVQVSLRYQY